MAFFLPQLVQLLRDDGQGQIAHFLLLAAAKSVIFAHTLICTLRVSGTLFRAHALAARRRWPARASTALSGSGSDQGPHGGVCRLATALCGYRGLGFVSRVLVFRV